MVVFVITQKAIISATACSDCRRSAQTCTNHNCAATSQIWHDGRTKCCVDDCPLGFNGTNCENDIDECAGTHHVKKILRVNDVYPYRCVTQTQPFLRMPTVKSRECKRGYLLMIRNIQRHFMGYRGGEETKVGSTCSGFEGVCKYGNLPERRQMY